MPRPHVALFALSTLLGLASGCNLERGGKAPAKQAPAQAGAQAGAQGATGRARPGPRATVREDVPLPLTKMLGHVPADVEALLGEPQTKGSRSTSCVRFVPERVFFACESVTQTYADKTGAFRSVTVTFEDGVSARVAFDGPSGDGPFTAEAALAAVGLELPFPPTVSTPAPDVTLWSWFNSQARLSVEDRDYRVEASVVEGKRERARIDVILNQPLDASERARILPVRGRGAPADAPADAPG